MVLAEYSRVFPVGAALKAHQPPPSFWSKCRGYTAKPNSPPILLETCWASSWRSRTCTAPPLPTAAGLWASHTWALTGHQAVTDSWCKGTLEHFCWGREPSKGMFWKAPRRKETLLGSNLLSTLIPANRKGIPMSLSGKQMSSKLLLLMPSMGKRRPHPALPTVLITLPRTWAPTWGWVT